MSFFDTPSLRENLDDLTLALGLGRPVFLLGAAGSGKSMLADEVAHELAKRYGVARVEGRADLGLDEVVAACHRGFATDAWNALAVGADETAELGRTGANLLIVDRAEAIPPSLIVQLVAGSGGVPGLLPSHRILFVGRDELADIIETWQMRNHRGAAVVVRLEPWHGDVVVPFVRHCLRAQGLCETELLPEPVIREIAAEADGNPGRMVEFARRTLQSAARDRAEPTDPAPPPETPRITVVKLAAVEKPRSAAPPEPPVTPALVLMPVTEMARSHPAVAPRRFVRVGLPVSAMIVAGGLIWLFERPATLDLFAPQPAVAVVAPVPPPVAAPTVAPAAATITAPVVPPPLPTPAAPILEAQAAPANPPADASQPAAASPVEPPAAATAAPAPVPETPPPVAAPVVQSQVQSVAPPAPPSAPPAATPVAAAVPAPAPAPVQASAPTVPEDELILRGDELLANGDFAAARLFYLQAAKTGSARAATAVARTYDPMVLTRLGVLGAHGEPDKAAEWYRRAVVLGDTAAAEPLRRLAPP